MRPGGGFVGPDAAYREMLAALARAAGAGMSFGLDRVRAALAAVGDPHRRLGVVVHVGGTNGKGSTAAFIEAALRHAGLRTGLYTSPHLCRVTERIRMDGVEVDGAALAARHARLDALPESACLTFFERTTVLAFMSFADAGTEAVVLEVGLGGRLDATNIVESDVAVVTGVAYDHERELGADLASIAREKAGIFKRGRPAIVGASGLGAGVPVLAAEARARGAAPTVVLGRDAPSAPPPGWTLGLRGVHQAANAAAALAALDALERWRGVRVGSSVRREALAATRWPGRLEEIALAPRTWLDAAHNAHGAQALAAELAFERQAFTRVVAVAGVSADKDARGVLAPVVALADLIVATQAPSPRALAAEELARLAVGIVGTARVASEPDPPAALALARREAGVSGLVVVFGSIFLVGAVRAAVLGETVDPLWVQDPGMAREQP